jgi:hypothetical protein
MPSASDYAKRFREDAQRLLDTRTAGLQQVFADLKAKLSSSLVEVDQCLGSIQHLEFPQADSVLGEALDEISAGVIRESKEERERVLSFLAHYAHELRQKETQEEILKLLLDAASRFAPRVALFVTREENFFGWSARGYSPEKAQEISKWSCGKPESPFLREALQASGLTSLKQRSAEPRLSELLGEESQVPWHAFPMRAIRRPVAVLLVAPTEGRSCELEPLCLLLDLTGLSIENLALKILQEIRQVETTAEAPAAPVSPIEEAPKEESAPRAFVPEPQPAAATQTPEEVAEPEAKTAAPEVVPEAPPFVEPASKPEVLPPVTPVEELVPAAQPGTVIPEMEPAAAVEAAGESLKVAAAEPEMLKTTRLREVQLPTEEEKLHSEARRFARLLVSEIKLYNEQQVQDGRTNGDLYLRLKRDVDRSRDMYEKRVSPLVARRADYFHDEIIRILAGNDPSTLGKDYPGPRVVE